MSSQAAYFLRPVATPEVRPALRADAPRVCRFLESARIPAATWRGLFEHHWSDDPAAGYVLTDAAAGKGDRMLGFLAATTARRTAKGRLVRVCNIGMWLVRPEYRAWSVQLLLAATRDPEMTYTDLTPTPAVARVLSRLGFQPLDETKLVMPPLLHASTLSARNTSVESDPVVVRGLLDEKARQVFDDHARHCCLQLAVVDGDGCAHIVLKRRVKRGVALSEVLGCSDASLLRRHLERVKLTALRRQHTLALLADARILGEPRPAGIPVRCPAFFRSPDLSPSDLDNLYSELVLLPI